LLPFASMVNGRQLTEVAVKEWIGLIVYWFVGYTSELLPAPAGPKQHRSGSGAVCNSGFGGARLHLFQRDFPQQRRNNGRSPDCEAVRTSHENERRDVAALETGTVACLLLSHLSFS
jgi:hypothetical protein